MKIVHRSPCWMASAFRGPAETSQCMPSVRLWTTWCFVGIQDAHNLAWKLAHVLGGARLNTVARDEPRSVAGKGLLATYTAERQPVAQVRTQKWVAIDPNKRCLLWKLPPTH